MRCVCVTVSLFVQARPPPPSLCSPTEIWVTHFEWPLQQHPQAKDIEELLDGAPVDIRTHPSGTNPVRSTESVISSLLGCNSVSLCRPRRHGGLWSIQPQIASSFFSWIYFWQSLALLGGTWRRNSPVLFLSNCRLPFFVRSAASGYVQISLLPGSLHVCLCVC